MSIVIEAEFVEVGKHQKVVTEIVTMNEQSAKIEFACWADAFWEPRKNWSNQKRINNQRIRDNLRSFGWYIVKSKTGYSLMEEVSTDDVCPNLESPLRKLWGAIINKQLNCASTKYFVKARDLHIVWVPSLQKRLIMRSVA